MLRYRRLIPYVLPQWRPLLVILLLTGIAPLAAALAPWPMKLLVDRAFVDASATLVVLASAATLGLFAISSALDAATSFAWTSAGQRMVAALASDLFAQLQRLSLLYHTRHPVGDSLSRVTGDAWCAYSITESVLVTPAQHLLTFVVIGAVAWQLDPVLTLIALAAAPALAAAVVFFGPLLKRRARMQRQADSQITSFVHQTLSSIPLVQAFATQGRNVDQYRVMASGAVALNQKNVVLGNAYVVFTGLATALTMAGVVYAGAMRVRAGALTVGGLLVFIAYLRALQGAATGLLTVHRQLKTADASLERVLEILDHDERIVECPNAAPLRLDPSARGLLVEFQRVSFGYEAGAKVIDGIDLRVEPGQVVALVGATGAGKSTLAALVARLIDPWEGSVRLGGQDVRALTLHSVRGAVGVVPQEPFLLPISIADNIAYGRPSASLEQIRRAAEAAGAAEFIERMRDGYETVIGERGATLSAGQRQRLAIARAILKDAPVLILDEPTSNLDARTEQEVMGAIEQLMRGRTCLVIAHRLSAARRADQIVVLEQGRIVERGAHEQLLTRGGVYAHLWAMQGGTEVHS